MVGNVLNSELFIDANIQTLFNIVENAGVYEEDPTTVFVSVR